MRLRVTPYEKTDVGRGILNAAAPATAITGAAVEDALLDPERDAVKPVVGMQLPDNDVPPPSFVHDAGTPAFAPTPPSMGNPKKTYSNECLIGLRSNGSQECQPMIFGPAAAPKAAKVPAPVAGGAEESRSEALPIPAKPPSGVEASEGFLGDDQPQAPETAPSQEPNAQFIVSQGQALQSVCRGLADSHIPS